MKNTKLLLSLLLAVPTMVWAVECPRSADVLKAYQERLKTHPEKDPFQMTDEERKASLEQALANPAPGTIGVNPPCEINQEDKAMAREAPGGPPVGPPTPEHILKEWEKLKERK